MKFSYLKKIRVIVSLIFFLLTAAVFLDFAGLIDPDFFNSVTYLQFVPSVLKFFTVFNAAAVGFIFILIITFLFGRVYCSSICPLGTLQDIISFLLKKIKPKWFYHYTKNRGYIRYSILLVTIISALTGFILILNLLDPFSNSGKIFTNLFRPVVISINNLTAHSLESLGIYSVYPHNLKGINFTTLIYPAIFLIGVFLLVYRNGRLFCNIICPVGSLLGFISKFSLVKISIDEHNCISCKLCERTCKGGCIDKENKEVDFSRCVGCYNCFSACHSSGITFSIAKGNTSLKKWEPDTKLDTRKRMFISRTMFSVFALAGLNLAQVKVSPKKKSTIPENRKHPVTPPGSKSFEYFNERCTACHLCISACPTQVLQPSLTEYGIYGFLQPTMDYHTSFCNFECNICTEVCPSGAIINLSLEKKKTVQLGKAKFIKENCIVYTENTACGACSEHCPTKAVNMVPYKNITIPEVKEEYCTGCGACEYACPTVPYKSIYVEGNTEHLVAQKRPVEKIEQKVEDDFPF